MTEPMTEQAEAEGSLIKDLLAGREINQQDLADSIQTSRVAVNQVINGRRGLTPLMALKLEAALGLPARPILERQMIRDLDRAYEENKDLLEKIRSNAKPDEGEPNGGQLRTSTDGH